MNKFSSFPSDLQEMSESLKYFVGEFFYAPFGIESSDELNTFTAAFIIGVMCYAILRHRVGLRSVFRGRQENEFGLMRQRERSFMATQSRTSDW